MRLASIVRRAHAPEPGKNGPDPRRPWRRSARRWRFVALAGSLPIGLLPVVVAAPASAGAGETGLITISPAAPASEPSGAPTSYSVAVSCEGTAGSSCGGSTDSTVTIPLTGTNTVPADMHSWVYSAVSGSSGLIDGSPQVVPNGSGGYNLVIDLSNSVFVAGYSGTITLQVTPPDNTTPNDTTWSLQPVVAGQNIVSVTAPTPATGEATAAPLPVITKFTDDGGSVYLAGSDVTYDITANCNNGSTGNLYMTQASLTDPLPPGMTYVSSTNGGSYNPGTDSVTWQFPTASSTPAGCAAGSSGPNYYQVVAATPAQAPVSQPLTNTATFAGQGPDAVNVTISGSTNAQASVDIVQVPPSGTGTCGTPGCPTISKSSLAPLAISGLPTNQYQGTYPGNWLATAPTPSYTVGAAPGSFRVNVNFPLTHTYQTQVVDPLPCLDDVSGNLYSSAAPTAAPCANPAFDTSVIEVAGPGLGAAVGEGWSPSVTLTDGSSAALTPTGTVAAGATSAYFSVPAPDLGEVATVVLPTDPNLDGDDITLTLWGYADASLAGGDQLTNTATATPYLNGQPLAPITASASLYIVAADAQLGVSKSFGTLGAGPGGTTVLNIEGAVSSPGALSNDVVITDLLPTGLSWSNVSTTGQFTLAQGSGASSHTVAATVYYETNYEGSGRDLIRVTVPQGDFASGGYWTITPPTDFFELVTPTALGTYPNSDQIFLYGYYPHQIDPECTTPTQTTGGITPATFESDNPLDLAGDGDTQEDYCQNGATLVVQPSGAAFNLTKTVQGNLDAVAKGALGIGDASQGGTGTYVLDWSNVGTDTLDDPVVFDILPYVGDTGVSQGQAGISRDSAFAPIFTSVGTLPSGVSVEYSGSTNPCRDQVYPNSANSGCANDWSASPPNNDPADVKALEFTDTTDQYPAGTGFSVSFTVTLPMADVNNVAWNSAATNAKDVSNPATIPLPAEPPKVGITAPTSGAPVISTTSSSQSLAAYSTTAIKDSVTIVGTNGNPGLLDWSFVGPVAAVASSCASVTWAGAATVASGTLDTPAADGVVTVAPATPVNVQGQGCYSWVDTLTLAHGGGTATLAAGAQSSEVVQATPYTTSLSSSASPTYSGGANKASDSVTVGSSGIGYGNGAPTSATMTWDLYGPATPVTAGTCTGVDWPSYIGSTSPLGTGTINVTGDGTYTTSTTTLTQVGCYTYTGSLPATSAGTAASTAAGASGETFILLPPPDITTTANQAQPYPRTLVSDSADIGHVQSTYGNSGTVAWQLFGPVAVPGSGHCSDVTTWPGTALASGSQGFTGDHTGLTVPSGGTRAGAPGCYSWAETISGPNFLGQTTLSAGASNEVFQVVPYQPVLATTAIPVWTSNTNQASDTVDVSSSDLGQGNGAPSSATLTWDLYGPAAPVTAGSCTGVDWSSFTTPLATNTVQVTEGTNHTQSVTLSQIGCYTYTESLASTTDTLAVATSALGSSGETFVLVTAPAVTTSANQATPAPRSSVSDAVTITGTSGFSGTVAWALVGPVAPVSGSCATVSWSGAPTRASGNQAVTGDQANLTVPTAGTAAGAPGCYSWTDTLTGANFLSTAPVNAGAANEVFQVPVLQPTLATTISTSVAGGAESASDQVVVGGTDIAPGNTTNAPTSGSVSWQLVGPVTAPSGGCSAVTGAQWTGAAVAGSGTITVTGNGTYNTPTTNNLFLNSCYSYTETLAATTDSAAVTVAAGTTGETAQVPPAPVVSTTAKQPSPAPRSTVSDAVTVTGTGGGTGVVHWSLVGPVAPVGGSCASVSWSGAATFASGTQAITGDQANLTVPTAGTTVGAPGCYSWVETVAGSTFPGSTTVSAGSTNEVFQVPVLQPTLATTLSTTVAAGVESAQDSIVVSGTDIVPGNTDNAPTSATMTWVLLGPVAPSPAGSCSGVTAAQWTGAGHAASGTITVTGNSTYTTPWTALALGSCYSYTETLPATTDSAAVTAPAGATNETTPVPPLPPMSSQTSSVQINPGGQVSDSVTISGIAPYTGSLAWQLVGPVQVASDGTCNGLNWASAPATPVGQGTVPISGNGTVSTGLVSVTLVGCYSWVETLTGTFPGSSTSLAAGATNETFQVVPVSGTPPHKPVLSSAATLSSGPDGAQTLSDSITLNGSGIGAGSPVPTGSLTWALWGPVAPVLASCSGADWTGATQLASGTITVNGDGVYATPATDLPATGCYSYTENLATTQISLSAAIAVGATAETVLVLAPPTVVTMASAAQVKPYGSVSDSVSVTGTIVAPGAVDWSLVGPVAAAADGTCTGLNWAGAPSVASGALAVTADGNFVTGPVAVNGAGCYGWVDAFSGAGYLGQSLVPAGSTNEVVLVSLLHPTLSTRATLSAGKLQDSVVVAGTGIGSAKGAPSAGELSWVLLGPAPRAAAGCASIDWTGDPVAADGTITVTGDGTYTTGSVPVAGPGCYTFDEYMGADAADTVASTSAGAKGETVDVGPPPPAPPTTVPPTVTTTTTTVPATTVPATTVPATTVPATTVPATTVPATTTTVAPPTATPTSTTQVTPKRGGEPGTPGSKNGASTTATRPVTTTGRPKPPPATTTTTVPALPTTTVPRKAKVSEPPISVPKKVKPRPSVTTTTAAVVTTTTVATTVPAPPPVPTTTAPDGLGAIGTDLGRWSPPSRGSGVAGALGLAAAVLLAGSSGVILMRRRRRRI